MSFFLCHFWQYYFRRFEFKTHCPLKPVMLASQTTKQQHKPKTLFSLVLFSEIPQTIQGSKPTKFKKIQETS